VGFFITKCTILLYKPAEIKKLRHDGAFIIPPKRISEINRPHPTENSQLAKSGSGKEVTKSKKITDQKGTKKREHLSFVSLLSLLIYVYFVRIFLS
jgi:hypothetical protein